MRLSRSAFSPATSMECQKHADDHWDNLWALTFITDTRLAQSSFIPCRQASTRDVDKQANVSSHAIQVLPECACRKAVRSSQELRIWWSPGGNDWPMDPRNANGQKQVENIENLDKHIVLSCFHMFILY